MPTSLSAPALTVADIRDSTRGKLRWSEPIDYWDCPQLPSVAGVYVWVARDSEAVIYIGKATSKHGLRTRLGDEIGWVFTAAQDEPALRPERWAGHPRTVLAMNAQAYWAVTETAADTERALLQLSLRLTGLVPIINGGAWWNRGLHFDQARAWAKAATRQLLGRSTSATAGLAGPDADGHMPARTTGMRLPVGSGAATGNS